MFRVTDEQGPEACGRSSMLPLAITATGQFEHVLYVHNNPVNFDDPFGLYQTRGFPADKQVELANAINEALVKLRNTCPSCAGTDGPKDCECD